jgi:hypothetical protein
VLLERVNLRWTISSSVLFRLFPKAIVSFRDSKEKEKKFSHAGRNVSNRCRVNGVTVS